MSKLISFAGVSRVAGVLKFRGANDVKRIDQLRKLGDTDVEMRFLGKEMTKSEAAKNLLAMNFTNGRDDIDALLVSVASEEVKPAKASKPRTVKVKSAKPRLIVGTTSVGADDAPYTPKQAAKIRAEFMKKLKAAYEAN